jgi:hypothetical protein
MHGYDFLVDIVIILLTLFNYLWLESGLAVLGDLDVHAAIAAVDTFGFITVTVIIVVRTLRFSIAKMLIHLCFHHFFDCAAKRVFECILDILCGLDVVFLQELLNNTAFSLCHLYLVYRFLFSCHNKRPPMIFILP